MEGKQPMHLFISPVHSGGTSCGANTSSWRVMSRRRVLARAWGESLEAEEKLAKCLAICPPKAGGQYGSVHVTHAGSMHDSLW